jgi:hypothetical protein
MSLNKPLKKAFVSDCCFLDCSSRGSMFVKSFEISCDKQAYYRVNNNTFEIKIVRCSSEDT